ncbi:hypothetical protein FQN49_001247 [Arthroderma sp. PD_2]|nr:hypothetical protein FQN49_001247 [Arthroderma sp. PD_2]
MPSNEVDAVDMLGNVLDVDDTPDNIHDDEPLIEIIKHCGPFLTLRDRSIYFVHPSARQFLLRNSFHHLFPSGIEHLHHIILSKSLQILSDRLRRDIYGLGNFGLSIDEVKKPDPDPLAAVRYSCVYWVDHLQASHHGRNTNSGLEDGGSVDTFLRQNYLHWLEALSLLESVADGLLAISKLEALVQGRTSRLAHLVRDACRFMRYHRQVIENSPLQIYTSAIVFSPSRNTARNWFQNEEPEWITIKPIMAYDWSTCLQALKVWVMAWVMAVLGLYVKD